MRFWDSSAIVSLLIREPATGPLMPLSRDQEGMTVWWGTVVECESAIARRTREGTIEAARLRHAGNELLRFADMWAEILPTTALRDEARRLLHRYALRAADAFQLASALIAADGSPATLPFVCLDDRLREAAEREGFAVGP